MLGVSFTVEGFLTWQYPVQQLGIRITGEAVPILGVPMPVGALVASGVAIAAALLWSRSSAGRCSGAACDR